VGGGCPDDSDAIGFPTHDAGKGEIPHGELTGRFGVTLRDEVC